MDCDKPMRATPAKDIQDHVMNVNIPKSEGEWWAKDKIEGLEADLESAVKVAFRRGAHEWVRLNYPAIYIEMADELKRTL